MPADTVLKTGFYSLDIEATSFHDLECCECGETIPAMTGHASLVMIDMTSTAPEVQSINGIVSGAHDLPDSCKIKTSTCTRCHDLATALIDTGAIIETGDLLSAYTDWLVEQKKNIPHWLVQIRPEILERNDVLDLTKLEAAAWEIAKMNCGNFPSAENESYDPSQAAKDAVANIVGLAYVSRHASQKDRCSAVYFGPNREKLTILED